MKISCLLILLFFLVKFNTLEAKTDKGIPLVDHSVMPYCGVLLEPIPREVIGSKGSFYFYISPDNRLNIIKNMILCSSVKYDFISSNILDSSYVSAVFPSIIILNDGKVYDINTKIFLKKLWDYEKYDVNYIKGNYSGNGEKQFVRIKNDESNNTTILDFYNTSNLYKINSLTVNRPRNIFIVNKDSAYIFYDDNIKIYTLEDSKLVNTISAYHNDDYTNLSDDGKYYSLASSSRGMVDVFEITGNESKHIFSDSNCYGNLNAPFLGKSVYYGKKNKIMHYDINSNYLDYLEEDHHIEFIQTYDLIKYKGLNQLGPCNISTFGKSLNNYPLQILNKHSRGNTLIASISDDETVIIEDRYEFNLIIPAKIPNYMYKNINMHGYGNFDFSPNGKLFLAFNKDYEKDKISVDLYWTQNTLWTDKLFGMLEKHHINSVYDDFKNISDVCFINNNEYLVAEMDGRICRFDIYGKKKSEKIFPFKVLRVLKYNSISNKVIVVTVDEQRVTRIFEYDYELNTENKLFEDFYDRFFEIRPIMKGAVALSYDDKYLSICSRSNQAVYILDLENNRIANTSFIIGTYLKNTTGYFCKDTPDFIYTNEHIYKFNYLTGKTEMIVNAYDSYFNDNFKEKNPYPFYAINNEEVKDYIYGVFGGNIAKIMTYELNSVGFDNENLIIDEFYPNPTISNASLRLTEGCNVESVTFIDYLGNRIENNYFSYYVYNNVLTIETNFLQQGLYFVKIITSNGIINKKIIVIK